MTGVSSVNTLTSLTSKGEMELRLIWIEEFYSSIKQL
jgi:hypothetical protein